MKLIFALVTFGFLVSVAKADVVKPVDTSQIAVGSAIVGSPNFDYKVIDRGWRTSTHVFPKPILTEAEKSFVISYTAKAKLSQEGLMALATALRDDADLKCRELGEIEFAESQKSLSATQKANASLSTRLIPHMDTKLAFDPGKDPGLFACNVKIKAQL